MASPTSPLTVVSLRGPVRPRQIPPDPYSQWLLGHALLLVVLLSTRAMAQSPGYLMGLSGGPYTSLSGVFLAPHGGQPFSQIAIPNLLPRNSNEVQYLSTMPGNRHLLVDETYATNYAASKYFLLNLDTGSYDHLVTVPPIPPLTTASPGLHIVDQEGDLIYVSYQQPGLYRLGADSRFQLFAQLPAAMQPSGFLVDVDTGDYVVSGRPGLHRVRPWGEVSTITAFQAGLGSQDPETGEYLMWTPAGTPTMTRLVKVTASGTITSTTTQTWAASAMVVDETPSALGEYVICSYLSLLWRVGRFGGPLTLLGGFSGSFAWSMQLERTRNVSTANAGARNRWHLLVDFPHDPGRPYVVLVGRSGIRPGLVLPDLRRIRLNPDDLTWRGLTGSLPGFTGLVGTLDARGTARGLIDLAAAPAGLRGTPFWMVGLALDPGPPVSIRRVSPVTIVQIR